MIHVVLFQPEIPGNTGNIIRLCANTGTHLHVIEPLGFTMDDKRLRRAGLDYHEWAPVRRWLDLETFLLSYPDLAVYALSTRSSMNLDQAKGGGDVVLLFGPETRGLPPEVLQHPRVTHSLRLPMRPESRSLNLSNAVAVVVYELWRQQGYPGAV